MKNAQSIKAAVIGSGVVGQASGRGFAAKGVEVIFCDINKKVIKKLRKAGFHAVAPEELKDSPADVYFFSVPTPTVDGSVVLDCLKQAVNHFGENVLRHAHGYKVVVVRSTVPPGTTRNIVAPLIEQASGKKIGADFGVCMNPEYLREKTADNDFLKPKITVLGSYDKKSAAMLENLLALFEQPIHHVSLEEAEFQKYAHNLFNAAKISFFNEMRMAAQKLKIDADKIFHLVAESAEASWNKNYGIRDLGPFSGSCLPKDTRAFLDFSDTALGLKLSLLKAVIDVNDQMKKKEE